VVEGDNRAAGHVITAVSGSGASRQTYNYATERVVGNGSFGVVIQATCLETAETVREKTFYCCMFAQLGREFKLLFSPTVGSCASCFMPQRGSAFAPCLSTFNNITVVTLGSVLEAIQVTGSGL
jgi:hypothetical protein